MLGLDPNSESGKEATPRENALHWPGARLSSLGSALSNRTQKGASVWGARVSPLPSFLVVRSRTDSLDQINPWPRKRCWIY